MRKPIIIILLLLVCPVFSSQAVDTQQTYEHQRHIPPAPDSLSAASPLPQPQVVNIDSMQASPDNFQPETPAEYLAQIVPMFAAEQPPAEAVEPAPPEETPAEPEQAVNPEPPPPPAEVTQPEPEPEPEPAPVETPPAVQVPERAAEPSVAPVPENDPAANPEEQQE
jgi:hypothetical protein